MQNQLQLFPVKETIFNKNGITVDKLNHTMSEEDGFYEYVISNGEKSFSSATEPPLEERILVEDIKTYGK